MPHNSPDEARPQQAPPAASAAPLHGHEDYERCMAAIREVMRDLDDLDDYLKELAAKKGRGMSNSPDRPELKQS